MRELDKTDKDFVARVKRWREGDKRQDSGDAGCICEGNWRHIIADSTPLLDKLFNDVNGAAHRFIGVMHCPEDYYYAMVSMAGNYQLLSCVGSLEDMGFTLMCE